MTESFVSSDFLSRDNTTLLYKHVTMANNMNNLNKQQKDQVIRFYNELIEKVNIFRLIKMEGICNVL